MKVKLKRMIDAFLERRGYQKTLPYKKLKQNPHQLFQPNFASIIGNYLDKLNDFKFIQVGANDGVSADNLNWYINNYELQGILIEPQLKAFNKLKQNYLNKNLIFENVAISQRNELKVIYSLKQEYSHFISEDYSYLRNNVDLFSSFNIEHVLHHLDLTKIKNINQKEFIQESHVLTKTIDEICIKHNWSRFDVLVIDTEGYDFKILQSVNLTQYNPKIICLEHVHLNYHEREDSINLLVDLGYNINIDSMDICACK
jgi:FkbM family methyltransferase